ncbi:inorganic pyrophosphatase [Caballeronia choica]|jgi:inorganic pyrophosphatase|uniref:Inorganic pyrophosphatase n=1 Tax=Caballeronia choica TaxID=326476 RepID=A0A158KTL5_9BURK|nr:inorganic pyrophosphatase [Caballeronia choica]
MSFNHVPAGKDLPQDFNVIIEIPAQNDPFKYQADKELGLPFVDGFISTTASIRNAVRRRGRRAGHTVPLLPGAVVRARALGMRQMTGDPGIDAKLDCRGP